LGSLEFATPIKANVASASGARHQRCVPTRNLKCVSNNLMWSNEFERRAAEMRERNEREREASRIGHEHLRIAELTRSNGAVERHYTVPEISTLWKLSGSSIIRIFQDEPGVLKIGPTKPRRGRRTRITLRIPEAVLQRVHRRMSVG